LGKAADNTNVLKEAVRVLSDRKDCLIVEVTQIQSLIDGINDQIDKTTQCDLQYDDRPVADLSVLEGLFSRMKLSTAVQQCLTIKNEPMRADQILQFLRAVGFVTDSLGDGEAMQIAKIAEALRKNTKAFHRLENGAFELVTRKNKPPRPV